MGTGVTTIVDVLLIVGIGLFLAYKAKGSPGEIAGALIAAVVVLGIGVSVWGMADAVNVVDVTTLKDRLLLRGGIEANAVVFAYGILLAAVLISAKLLYKRIKK